MARMATTRYAALIAVTGLALVTACTAQPPPPDDVARKAMALPPVAFAFAVTPADRQSRVPVSEEVGIKVDGGSVEKVSVVDPAGKEIAGSLREDGSSW